MNCCQPSGIPEDATERLFRLLKVLRGLSFALLPLAVLNLLVSFMSGIGMLLLCLVIYLVRYMKNFQLAVIGAVLFLFLLVVTISESGSILAKNKIGTNAEGFFMFFFMMKIPLYFLIVFYMFLTYRELKAIFLQEGSGGRDFQMESLEARRSFIPFGGQGHSAG